MGYPSLTPCDFETQLEDVAEVFLKSIHNILKIFFLMHYEIQVKLCNNTENVHLMRISMNG